MVSVWLHNGLLSITRFLTKILKLVFLSFHNPDYKIMRNLDDSFLVEGTLIAWQKAVFSTVKLLINLWCQVYSDRWRRVLNSLWKK